MLTYYFRFIGRNRKPTGHIGLAVAANARELFWEIDQYGDPGCVQLHPVESGSFCIKITEDEELEEINYEEFEITDYLPDPKSRKWRSFSKVIDQIDPYTPTTFASEMSTAEVSQ